ncbi:MAG: 4Fe-4S dicluster domain-containing protein [Anaerolineae bacterium]|nr:4Fe-4S dicluster domain-containing protein [Anaerolineae bacterium]
MRTILPVENNDPLVAIRGFLKRLLETGAVDVLLVPVETQAGAVTPMLVADPDQLDAANPLAPVMGVNAARAVSRVTVREAGARIGAVLRPCELRALIELVKLKQASLDNLVTIGLDCAGTYDVPDYTAKAQKSKTSKAKAQLWRDLYDELGADPSVTIPALRDACQMCEKPHVERADITLELFGADLVAGIPVTLPDEVAEKLGLRPAKKGSRAAMIKKVVAARKRVRDAHFGEMRQRLEEESIEGVLAACVRCHNCMTVCPICYCKTCLFQSPLYDREPMQYANWARSKGACRLPADTMLFHLTRLNHMALSCVGCGMCTSGCPAELPVGLVFRTVGQQVQATFEYAPGRDAEEPLPLVTFQEDEWMEAGAE